ncbi:DMT family transporter [Propionispora vibrioides]|uniref:Permease of the drug/metabolite transporter (DMT) superfamily n=1 Tax=Propionispora vibrioides TaxID=112903 RepID=A0A1H8Y177_9FIRM|nr:DMT family transporter [Propionispora vibrioides]SEP45905.1 Permease of the drug/metabolite transporter (DMT) superfamily [Propionispora vibrioides]
MLTGHALACLTIFIWGTTFISTKVLLKAFSPVEILFLRFVIGFIALSLAYPYRLPWQGKKQELHFAAAGLCGITLYFLLENIALTYTLASNVGTILSVAPFFTAMFAHLFLDGEKLRLQFFLGFALAMTGIFLISFNGRAMAGLNPLGDLLALLAAVVWAAYSILTKKIAGFRYNTIQTTRRIFLYGLLFMLPALGVFGFIPDLGQMLKPVNWSNLLFLGLGASALCFVTWNVAVTVLGAVKTSVYIYLVPVITAVTASLVLQEQLTGLAVVGMAFTLTGLFFSERKFCFPVRERVESE